MAREAWSVQQIALAQYLDSEGVKNRHCNLASEIMETQCVMNLTVGSQLQQYLTFRGR